MPCHLMKPLFDRPIVCLFFAMGLAFILSADNEIFGETDETTHTSAAEGAQKADSTTEAKSEALQANLQALVHSLMVSREQLQEVSFAQVIEAATGHEMVPFDPNSKIDRMILRTLRRETQKLIQETRKPNHPIHEIGRINEVSGAIEDELRERLHALEKFECRVPVTTAGERQRSGYPDLVFIHTPTQRTFYLDPKVFKHTSKKSSFRTFYYEPKRATNKVNRDATHLLIGFPHKGRAENKWIVEAPRLADLVHLKVRLKAEFQASNRDLYREEALLKKKFPQKDKKSTTLE